VAWVLDTNILSELRRPRPDPRVVEFVAGRPLQELYVSSVTFAEIRFGIELAAEPDRRLALTEWLSEKVRPMFLHRVLEITEEIMLRWRQLVEEGRKSGKTYSQPDLIIAATALHHGLTLATRNTADFTGLGLTLFNPWDTPQ
jgi:toxin FitB